MEERDEEERLISLKSNVVMRIACANCADSAEPLNQPSQIRVSVDSPQTFLRIQ